MNCPFDPVGDPRVVRTRNLLRDAMRALLKERRYDEISVQEVTARATVNRATFYAHYTDKEALARDVFVADFWAFMHARTPEFPEFSRESLEVIAVGVFEFTALIPAGCPKAIEAMEGVLSRALQEELLRMFKAWLEQSSHPYVQQHRREMATVLSFSLLGAAYRWYRGEKRRTAHEVAAALVEVLCAGFGPVLRGASKRETLASGAA